MAQDRQSICRVRKIHCSITGDRAHNILDKVNQPYKDFATEVSNRLTKETEKEQIVSTIQAVIVTPDAPGRLAIGAVEPPTALPTEALVRVATFSLNRGEVRGAQGNPAGNRIGWDLAGTVEQAAGD